MKFSPTTVELRYSSFGDALQVDVYDADTRDLITHDTIGNIAAWLRDLGFTWRWGSNGIWERTP